jgi:hypothetical protein
MYREILLTMTGVAVYPVISLILFTLTFSAVLMRVARMDRALAARIAALPLERNADDPVKGV